MALLVAAEAVLVEVAVTTAEAMLVVAAMAAEVVADLAMYNHFHHMDLVLALLDSG
jgi:hypothetical protein